MFQFNKKRSCKYKTYINDLPQDLVDDQITQLQKGKEVIVAIDTEAMGLLNTRDRLCVVQLCFGDSLGHIVQMIPQIQPETSSTTNQEYHKKIQQNNTKSTEDTENIKNYDNNNNNEKPQKQDSQNLPCNLNPQHYVTHTHTEPHKESENQILSKVSSHKDSDQFFSPQSLSPNLFTLLSDSRITKLFHFARFDVAILQHHFNITMQNIYCTKIASKLARTYTDHHGLRELCNELLGIKISKQQQSSDWGQIHLSEEQLEYAAKDVLYLHAIKQKLDEMLLREGHYHYNSPNSRNMMSNISNIHDKAPIPPTSSQYNLINKHNDSHTLNQSNQKTINQTTNQSFDPISNSNHTSNDLTNPEIHKMCKINSKLSRMEIAKKCFEFIPARAQLDTMGWNYDILEH